ncbi:MAG: ABC transporter ATP-binding protein/permease [Treponema sp.]|jgi:ATP-binding cassette subfamily B protein|nr:ABC transporter ATP-binding protein/permease [Treponema sp.]
MSQSGNRIGKFVSFYKPYTLLFVADITCALAVSVISLILPLCVRYITQDALGGVTQDLSRGALVMLALISVQTACALFYDYMGHKMGAWMERDMRNELFAHYQKLPFNFFDKNKTGALMSRITHDLLNLAELYHHGPEDLMIYGLRFLGALIILMNINSRLALVVCAFLPVMAAYSLFFQGKMRAAYRNNRERLAELNAQLEDSIGGIRVVKSFANEEREWQKFAGVNEQFFRGRAFIYKREAFYFTGMEYFFAQLITVAVVAAGSLWISRELLDVADLITFLLYVGYLTAPISRIAFVVQQYQDGFAGFNRFMEIMETAPETGYGNGLTNSEAVIQGHVQFVNVSFKYDEGFESPAQNFESPAQNRKNVLEDISLDIKPGESVAIIGHSGVGKTTLCALIPRFYEVNAGMILVDGVDVRSFDLQTLRRHIGVVQQDVYLFAGTVFDNIRYGKPDSDDAEIITAAKKANAHDFIMSLPNGYNSDIGQRGVKLSGGQRQRLSIARVFLKNPPILIFDEATSALDNESERIVHEALTDLAKNRATFIIAHRLSTVRNAGRIIVLTEQGIGEQGTHAELMQRNGLYAHWIETPISAGSGH